ncbi:hypothetical protein [Microbacterium invictum]|uniref:Uncharacterized protein n=1 Tax=Microbacterium invictum TaxID=515415 RepID=A0ABZ0VAP0_9MICO|nr:hypothetical protein [Microbacterium invictum]WQB69872.1 hypothetical protein T9R20_14400 [Microbacterium invictum]
MNVMTPLPTTSSAATADDAAFVASGAVPRRRSRIRRVGRAFVSGFAVIGVVATGAVITGGIIDFTNFDRTSGGYEAPYTGWTGTPIDWTAGGVTEEGFRNDGLVIDTLLDCTSGMISFDVYGIEIPFRVVSERAVAVHRPVEACEAEGFSPDFTPTPGA